jgi:hypothetical protein
MSLDLYRGPLNFSNEEQVRGVQYVNKRMTHYNGWITPANKGEVENIKTLGLLIDLDFLFSDLRI